MMDFLTRKDPITVYLEEKVRIEKDPKIQGFKEGAKAALLAAPIGAAIQAIRGKGPRMGAFVAGVGAGTAAGLLEAARQKIRNKETEAELRYHMRNVLEQEPMVMAPPPAAAEQVYGFSQGFNNVYNPY